MIKTIIFDFDGTIADSAEVTVEVIKEISETYGFAQIQKMKAAELKELSAKELVQKYQIPLGKLPLIVRDVRKGFENKMESISMVRGMSEAIQELSGAGIQLGIVTSNSAQNVEKFLDKHGVNDISFILGEKKLWGKGGKLTRVIKQRQLNLIEVAYVGDEVRDVEAARKAGVAAIAVDWGFNSARRLKQARPDELVSSPKLLIQAILKLD